jgi:hypothetical protein
MKNIIAFICVIAVAITINSCQEKRYYACCDSGHPHWQGDKTDSKSFAQSQSSDHDKTIHGGVKTAGICHTGI